MEIVSQQANYTFNIQTVQSGAFRILIEALKDILTDYGKNSDSYWYQVNRLTDSSHNVFNFHMKLHAENFDFYECKEQCIIGVSMTNMYKLIKTMDIQILTLFLENNKNIRYSD